MPAPKDCQHVVQTKGAPDGDDQGPGAPVSHYEESNLIIIIPVVKHMIMSSVTLSLSLMAAKLGLEDTISLHQNLCFRPIAAQGGIAIKVGAHGAAVANRGWLTYVQ